MIPMSENELAKLIPPNSIETEQAILGAILMNPCAIVSVADDISPEDFYRGQHTTIFSAMCKLFRMSEPVDIVSVAEILSDDEHLDQCGGRAYLMELALSVATSENVGYYAKRLKELSMRRQLIWLGNEISEIAHEKDAEEAISQVQTCILNLVQTTDKKSDPCPSELARNAIKNVEEKLHHPNRITGIKTGFLNLDKYLGGLQEGRLIILGARPSMGKSGLALNIAQNVAKDKNTVLFYSLEMEPVKLVERALVAEAESYTALDKLHQASLSFPSNLHIIDRPSLTLASLRASMLKMRMEYGDLGLVVIDYLQLMRGIGGNRNEEVSSISRGLKLLAREFKVPVLALAQLSREVEKRQDKRPMNSDLRDSGAVEQDADTVIFLYRDEYYNPESNRPGVAEVIIGKNRDGSVGKFDLLFRKDIVKFKEPGLY